MPSPLPAAWLPVDADGKVNYVSSTLTSGRQTGRGIESLAISPDDGTLFALLQDPLINEGGRNARNVRLATIDVATGLPTAEYVYQLESLDTIKYRQSAGRGGVQGESAGATSARMRCSP